VAIEFSRPLIGDKALSYLHESLVGSDFSGDGSFTRRCHEWLKRELGSPALLTHSCTAALEMAALLSGVGPGDEVILPSFTFSSTANAFVLRGATPVFIDIRPDTLNLDENLLDVARTSRTRAIVPVHYAGVGCEMDTIRTFARAYNLIVIEDAAQAQLSTYRGAPLGTLGALGCFSFHLSKNVVSGEGGALIINDEAFLERAHIVREKGTNRTAFLNRKVDKYEWIDVGSSFLPSDLLAALLYSQLEDAAAITARRISIWNRYHKDFESAEKDGRVMRPRPPAHTPPNGHIYYILLPAADVAQGLRRHLAEAGVPAHNHYVPLHSAPAGRRFGRTATEMKVTDRVASTILRLPIHAGLSDSDVDRIGSIVHDALALI
jgi:dTDP-4-amino-4,6-dideoxygalactose transaminase